MRSGFGVGWCSLTVGCILLLLAQPGGAAPNRRVIAGTIQHVADVDSLGQPSVAQALVVLCRVEADPSAQGVLGWVVPLAPRERDGRAGLRLEVFHRNWPAQASLVAVFLRKNRACATSEYLNQSQTGTGPSNAWGGMQTGIPLGTNRIVLLTQHTATMHLSYLVIGTPEVAADTQPVRFRVTIRAGKHPRPFRDPWPV